MTSIRFARLALLALTSTLCVSCASLTRGSHDKITVQSTPAGADVRFSNGMTGVTPGQFKLPRKDDVNVTVSKSGYESQTVQLRSMISKGGGAATAGNVLIGGIIGIGIDAATGATKDLFPNPVIVTLQPKR
jgi:hypothetical protein